MGNFLSVRILWKKNESSSLSEEKRSKIVNNLIEKFFSKSKSLKVEGFIEQNRSLLMKLHPALEKVMIMVENGVLSLDESSWPQILLQTVMKDMHLTCEEFQFNFSQLKICDNFKDIVYEIIPSIESNKEGDVDDLIAKRELFRQFIGHLLWVTKCLQEYCAARDDFYKIKTLYHRAAKYYKTNAELWLESAKFEIDIHLEKVQEIIDRILISLADDGFEINPNEWLKAAEETNLNIIKEAVMISLLKFVPDLEWLRIAVAIIDIENGNRDKVQEIIDRALISFADDGFEINPYEWLKAAEEANSNEIIDAVMTSSMDIKGSDENVKLSDNYLNREKRILFQKLRASSMDKHLWIRVIFHKKICLKDLKLFLIIACENNPDDVAFGDLTQAKIQWIDGKFAKAQRLFKKIEADAKWGSLIIKEFKEFFNELKTVRAERQKLVESTLSTIGKTSDFRWKSEAFKMQMMILKEEWLLGEHDFVQEVLKEAVLIAPDYADFWLMKLQIEVKKDNYDTADATLVSAIEALSLTHERYSFLLFAADLYNECGDLQKARYLLENARSSSPFSPNLYAEFWIALIRFNLNSNEISKAHTLLAETMLKIQGSGELWAASISMEERSKRGKKSVEALRICQHQNETQFVMLETAKLFLSLGRVEKSRKWFNKTVEEHPYFYDAWIFFYKLEKIWGTEKSARDILIQFMQLKTEEDQFFNVRRLQFYNYRGEKWCSFEHHIDNWPLTREELFLAIVDKLDVGSI